jgi:hypothetical protein
MRPGEVRRLQTLGIDTSVQPWVYRPASHKTAWRGRERTIFIGPKAQKILEPLLNPENPEAYLFPPRRTHRDCRGPGPAALVEYVRLHPKKAFIPAKLASQLSGMSISAISKLAHVHGVLRFRSEVSGVRVYVRKFPDRLNLSLHWWNPIEGKIKTRTTETTDPAVAERQRVDLERFLNHGRQKETTPPQYPLADKRG